MSLTDKEKTIAIIANGIAVFSLLQENNKLDASVTMYDFVLQATPSNLKSHLSAVLIDEVFQYVSSAHSS